MDIHIEKQWLIEEIARIQDSELIQAIKKLILSNPKESVAAMSKEELSRKIEAAEKAYAEGRVTSQSDLLEEIKTWRNK